MKKAIILGIFIMAFVLGIIAWLFLEKPKVFFTTTSPTGVYTVELIGDKSRPSLPWMNHKVSFNLYKNDNVMVENGYVYSGDLFDSDFAELFPENKWVNQSVFRVGAGLDITDNNQYSMIISNKTNKVIKYLKVGAKENLFFIFEILPNSKIELLAPLQPYISAIGEFENGQIIKRNGINFIGKPESISLGKTCITIVEDSIKIENTSSAGYTGENNSNHENPDVPKIAQCQ
ncbi:MAG: hypothetical protein K1X72_15740 [Pyrinomonadaceae bacterium]|nr:hypothetical protein [Pyrinomonadaceae bacterium]